MAWFMPGLTSNWHLFSHGINYAITTDVLLLSSAQLSVGHILFVCLCELAIGIAGLVIILCQTTLRQLLQVLSQPHTLLPHISPWKEVIGLNISIVYSLLPSSRGYRSYQTSRSCFHEFCGSWNQTWATRVRGAIASNMLELSACRWYIFTLIITAMIEESLSIVFVAKICTYNDSCIAWINEKLWMCTKLWAGRNWEIKSHTPCRFFFF